MTTLISIAVSLVASAVIFIGGMNLPASTFSLKSFTNPIFGAFTEISTVTNLADFPTTYNANLNKTIEVGTTSVASITTLSNLATIGTIISGIWNGTAIGVSYGGTGTTSPTSNQVILGNGSSGLKVVSGFGTTGQFLTSNGSATAPTWQTSSIALGDNYTWTGTHIFNGSTDISATNINGGLSPVGSITAYASSTPPTGWLLANGQAINRTTYANLYTIIGTQYGVGNGSTTFNVPNLAGTMLMMASSTNGISSTLGSTGGATTTTIGITNLPSSASYRTANGNNDTRNSASPDNFYGTFTAGSDIPAITISPYTIMEYIIKY